MKRRVVAFELNEVPWRVLDDFIDARPESNFARLMRGAASFTTKTPDRGHLSPWITWPTMHRGVENTRHGIHFLGQEIDNRMYPAIWQTLVESGRRVGVFGALQSWPPPQVGEGFFVPDMFAKDATCHPAGLQAFQRMNLDLTSRNGRVLERSVGVGRVLRALPALVPYGLRLSTLAEAGSHVVRERLERRYTYRRPVYQAVLGFDLFRRQLQRHLPDYSSFFTNHVAGLMHRFWRAAYPHDYDEGVPDEAFYHDAILWGMQVADGQLGALMRFAEQHRAVVAVASSMGQAAIQPRDDPTSLKLQDPAALLSVVGFRGDWKRLQAMEPQVPIETDSPAAAGSLMTAIETLRDDDDQPVFRVDVDGKVASLTIVPSRTAIKHETIRFGNERRTLEEAGIIVIQPETPGTAYHVPEGHLLFWGEGIVPDSGRRPVSSLEYAPTLLQLLDVPRRAYHLSGLANEIVRNKA